MQDTPGPLPPSLRPSSKLLVGRLIPRVDSGWSPHPGLSSHVTCCRVRRRAGPGRRFFFRSRTAQCLITTLVESFLINHLQGWAFRKDHLPLSRAEDAAAAGPTLTVGPRWIDGTDTSIKTSSSRRPPTHRGACGGVVEVERRVYVESVVGDGSGSCR